MGGPTAGGSWVAHGWLSLFWQSKFGSQKFSKSKQLYLNNHALPTHQTTTSSCPGLPPRVTEALHSLRYPPAIVVVDSAPACPPNSPTARHPQIATSHHPPHSLLDPSTPNTHQSTTNSCPGRL